MATATLLAKTSETWIYPPKSYIGVDYVSRPKNTWSKNHSDPDRRNKRYQAGNDVSDGDFNGNMMSHFLFSTGTNSMREFISSIGGVNKITSIKLRLTCGHSYHSAMNLKICLGPYWHTSKYEGKTADTYDGLGIKFLTSVNVNRGATKTIDLTAYKSHFGSYESITLYAPGAYNKDYNAYGWVYGEKDSTVNTRPQLVITYATNSAPNKPGIKVTSTTDSLGYSKPSLNISMTNNGDPDNNIHSTPYYFQLLNDSGTVIKTYTWQTSNKISYDASSYRGKSLKVRAVIRDADGLTAETSKTVYINSLPYWTNLTSEKEGITFTSGVTNGIYKNNITLTWPKATDSQKQTIKYNVYCQVGTDSGASGDTSSRCVAEGLTTNSFTIDATTIKGTAITKGQRIYFSVWAYDGLEFSSYRIVSSWIYREQPPSAPTNVSPTEGNFESSVYLSWSKSSGSNGSEVQYYKIGLIDESNSIIKSYTSTETYFTCNDIASQIDRGKKFKFKITAVDNLGNDSDPGYSGTLTRNSAPSDPKNFKITSSSVYVKDKVGLSWTASTDADGDTVKYNIGYSVNNGAYQVLAKGLTKTTYDHNISSLSAGDIINYYVEAYDTFNVYSNKVYIATKPQVNTPPSKPTFSLPYQNRELFSNSPRITFNVGSSNNGQNMVVSINVNGVVYSSNKDVSYFDNQTYSSNSTGMFIVPDTAPLNYANNNLIKISANDGLDTSNESSITISCSAMKVTKKESGDSITATDLNALRTMINANRFAYGLDEKNWKDGFLQSNTSLIAKTYFEEAINSIHELNTTLNNKTSSASLKRFYTKDVIGDNSKITKDIFNNIYDVIKKS